MESLNALKNRYVSAKNRAESMMMVQNWSAAKSALEEASMLLGQVYEREPSAKNKEAYAEIRIQLQEKYNECKVHLGQAPAPELTVESGKSQPANKPQQKQAQQKQAKGEKPKAGEPEDDGIVYEFNGINVKNFLITEARKQVFFSDVIGMEDEKAAVRQELFISDEMKAYKESIGLENKNFILLYGLPGTGKTYFAMALSNELRAFAGDEHDIPFFSVICTQMKDSKVGATENNIIALFEFTKQFERCVIFMDEFDAIGPSRNEAHGDPTAIPVVNTLLQQLQGFSSNPNLLFLAATNCPYNLDGALLSRASLRIEVPLPSAQVLKGALERKLGKLVTPDVDLDEIAKTLERKKYSNRDCSNLIQAALSEVFNAHTVDASINHLDADMMKRALDKVKSSIKADEVAALERFKHQSI